MNIILFLLFFNNGPGLSMPQPDTVYVSTIGSKLFLRGSAQFRQFFVLKMENTRDAQRAIQFLGESSAPGNPRYQSLLSLLLREIDRRDYARENCILLCSPRTYDLSIGQPFRIKGNTDLIFPVATAAQKEREGYSYVRVLVTQKSEENMRIYVRTQLLDIKPAAYQGAP